ncbi:MAG: sugar ABC transporter permease [Anaerolineae bacterium]|nr:sugar ABC transporter permease [Anaerolineae bacterium]MDQ7036806.1 sugar ABC transporter permease [Anaerolineae bacterium]
MTQKSFNPLPYLLILPTLIFILLFTVYPTFQVLRESQVYFHPNRPERQRDTDLNLPGIESETRSIRGPYNVGFAYFRAMFNPSTTEGEIFYQVMGNTLRYTIVTVPVSILLAFLFALLVNRTVQGIGLARVALFYPTMLPMVSAATIWLFFFTPEYGLWNAALRFFGYRGAENWVINRDLALYGLMIVAIWKNAGYFMIFYLAGLQGLPDDIFEAADLDGATWLTKIMKITLPLLRRTTLFITVIAIIGAFQNIDHALILTNELVTGEADLLLYEIYQQRFVLQNYGFANALTVVMITLLLLFTIVNFLLSERSDDQ